MKLRRLINLQIDIVVGRISGFGGVERVIEEWFQEFSTDSGTNLRIVLPIGTEDTKWLEEKKKLLNDISTKNKGILFSISLIYAVNYFLKTDSDILVIENYRLVRIATTIKKIFKKKYQVVSWMHQSLHIKKNMARWLVDADAHLAISSGIKDQLMEVGVPRKKIHIIYNPVEYHVDKVIKAPLSEEIELIYIGRPLLDGQKNLRELFSALKKIQSKKKIKLQMYGVSKYDTDIVNYINELDISKSVELHGWAINPWKNIDTGTALVLTSKYEGLGMVLIEAISRGLPVISSNIQVGPKDIIKDGINGYLYELGNEEQLVEKIIKLNNERNTYREDVLKNSINCFYKSEYFANLKKILSSI